MKWQFYKGIRFKMTLLFSIVFILLNLFFGGIMFRYFKEGYIKNYNKYIYSKAQRILDRTEINPDIIALPDSGESIHVFYHPVPGRIQSVFQSPGSISKLNLPSHPGIVDSLGLYGVYLKKENYDGRPVELLFVVSDFELREKLNQFSTLMKMAIAVSLMLSSIAAFFASGWLLKPVRSIARQAVGMNTKRLGERIEIDQTHDELQLLAQTINDMIGRIEHEQQTRNNFFAAASHELRTPLANLRAQTEVELLNKNSGSYNDLLNSQLNEIGRLQSIVEQFLLISEFNNDGIVLRKRRVDISDQLLKIFSRNNREAKVRKIIYEIHFSEGIESFLIFADTDKLAVVWQNLIQNAIKYCESETALKCNVEKIGDNMQVTFENKINQSRIELSELKTPFNKGQSTTSGSGLGIWLCKEIIEAHGGLLALESQDQYFKVAVLIPIM